MQFPEKTPLSKRQSNGRLALKQFRVVAKTFSFTTSQTAAGKMLIALGQVKLEPLRAMHPISLIKSVLFLSLFSFAVMVRAQTPPAKPQYGAWGFDLPGADTKTKPGDDFFRYANGTWIDKTQIPPDKPAYSLRLAMTDLTEQRLHEMMEALAGKDVTNPSTLEEKVAAFYRSFMDEARIE